MSTAERDREFWERIAPRYDGVSKGVFGRPMPRALELTADGVSGAASVLEVAAGTGLVTQMIAPRADRVIATDYADAMLTRLRARVANSGLSNVECARGDIYALPYQPDSFDAVVASNVLHLVPDLPGALRALRRVLRPGGKLIAPTFCHDQTRLSWLVSRALDLIGQPMHRRFTADSLRQALEAEELQIARSEVIPGLIPITYVEGIFAAAAPQDAASGK